MTECAIHPHGFDDDCDYCVEETNELHAKYDKQVKHNNTIETDLHAQGMGVDPQAFMMLRMNMILSAMFGENHKARTKFEITYAKECEKLLMQAQSQSARAKLLSGVNGAKVLRK